VPGDIKKTAIITKFGPFYWTNAIWLEECFEHFHPNYDRGLSRMDAIILESLCGWPQYTQYFLV
jgi:hypothetical protein